MVLQTEGKDPQTRRMRLCALRQRPPPLYRQPGRRRPGRAACERGAILVDDHLRTNVPGIYAIGDVVPGPMLAHKASYDGECAIDNILGHERPVDYRAIPDVIFTLPEIASVGITEA